MWPARAAENSCAYAVHARFYSDLLVAYRNAIALSQTREQQTDYEWANLCFIQPTLLAQTGESVYQQLTQYLPLTLKKIVSFEMDTKCDMEEAIM